MNLAERINQRMTTLQLTQADIARGIGVSAPTVHDWCSGDIKVLKSQNMKKLAAFLQCRQRWLEDGVGPMALEATEYRVMEHGAWGEPMVPWATVEPTKVDREIFSIIAQLSEPAKKEVLTWLRGFDIGRKAATAGSGAVIYRFPAQVLRHGRSDTGGSDGTGDM